MGTEELWVPLVIGLAAAAGTEEISRATKPSTNVPSPGPDPLPKGIPTTDAAAIQARIAQQRDLSYLRVDAAANPGVNTGLQIPN